MTRVLPQRKIHADLQHSNLNIADATHRNIAWMCHETKPSFKREEQSQLKRQLQPCCEPPLVHARLMNEFVVPNALPVCTRCGESTHTKAICLKFRIKTCDLCKSGTCTFDPCWYAESPEKVRNPKLQTCIRVRVDVFQSQGVLWKRVKIFGCGAHTHRFKNCPWTAPTKPSTGTQIQP